MNGEIGSSEGSKQPLQLTQYILKELITTEKDYLNDLNTAINVSLPPSNQ
jgi:hypothetical protein